MNTTKITITDNHKLSTKEGLRIQQVNLITWQAKLSPACYNAVLAEADRRNDALKPADTGFDVWRGGAISEFIQNWTPVEPIPVFRKTPIPESMEEVDGFLFGRAKTQ